MDFMQCNYYEDSVKKGHCPFDKVCSDECYFSMKVHLQEMDEILEENKELSNEINYLEDYKFQVENYEEENNELSKNQRELVSLFKYHFTHPEVNILDVLNEYELGDVEAEILSIVKGKVNMKLDIVCEDQKYMPEYANETDACMDLKVKIEDELKYDTLSPGESKVFGTGIKVKIPEGYYMTIYPRSSTGFKLHCMLANTVGIIDNGYRDEIKLKLYNFGNEEIYLNDGQRVAQFTLLPKLNIELNKVKENNDFKSGDRGGGIGSTGS